MQRVEFANTLRGIAAFSVLFAHYFSFFWRAPKPIASMINTTPLSAPPEWVVKTIFPAGHLAPFGVALFFLISGFVIPFSLSRVDAWTFLYRRVLRIYPTYMTGFLISLIAIYISGQISNRDWQLKLGDIIPHFVPGLRDLWGVPMIDGIIWTLDIEVRFYIVCASAAFLFRRKSLAIYIIPFALCLLTLPVYLITHQHPDSFSVSQQAIDLGRTAILTTQFICYMFLGTVFFGLYQGLLSQRIGAILLACVLSTYLCIAIFGPDAEGRRFVPNYLAALAIFTISFAYRDCFRPPRMFGFLANVSYPLYVVHAVSGYVSLYWLTRAGVPFYISLAITVPTILTIAYLVHRFVEKPTRDWRHSLRGTAKLSAE